MNEPTMERITAVALREVDGSLLIFDGKDENDLPVVFVADHRCGQPIIEALYEYGETPVCQVPDYMILSRARRPA